MSDRVPLPETIKQESPLQGIKDALEARGEAKFNDNLDYMADMEYHRVADFLDVPQEDRRDQKMAERLSFLYDWAKEESKSDDRLTRLETIRGLQRLLGIQQTGPETVKKLVQYVRLSQDIKRKEREIELLKNAI